MRVGIVLHGPEIVDVGSAKRIIEIFRKEHDVIAKLGGTMGRTAVLDAGLEKEIDISQGLTPSETINSIKNDIDLAILLNHGKTLHTGRYFGQLIASKLLDPDRFVHIERPDYEGRIIYYSPGAKKCAEYVRALVTRYSPKYDLQIESSSGFPLCIRSEGGTAIRHISGAFVGENIRLNGIVIGEVTHPELEIVCRDGIVVELRGGKIKPHGLEKLSSRKIDLSTAKVKTGNIRRTRHNRLIKPSSSQESGTIAIIDHCAESTFELIKDASMVIAVGDDTTAIAADILTRFGIHIIGITDGDLDSVLPDTEVPAGSVIIRVREGYDDILGQEVFKKIMNSKQQLKGQNNDDLLSRILDMAEKEIIEVIYY